MANPKKVGLIGNGAIAGMVSNFCAEHPDRFSIVSGLALITDEPSVGEHALTSDLDTFLARGPDIAVECAGHGAVTAYGAAVLSAGVDLIIASVGSLADDHLAASLIAAAQLGGSKLEIPSGAAPGVDAISAAKIGGLDSVSLRSSKAPLAWTGTPAERQFDLAKIDRPTVIFSGTAREAARQFPKNANIAATLALAGLGFERTTVELVADPAAVRNTHRIKAEGAFGSLELEIQATTAPTNPKTSYIAALSIMRSLDNSANSIRI